MNDYIVRATAADGYIRAFAIRSTGLAEEARRRHDTTPVMTAALGRTLSAAAMMGAMMKGDEDVLTIRIKSDGPAEGILVTADSRGNVKGYVHNPHVLIPLKRRGKLDVGGAVAPGTLSVTKDLGLKEPYTGQCELQTGEIGDDLAYYFMTSEQTPSAVGLGVLVDTDCTVKQAGGFIIQLMPFAKDDIVDRLEARLAEIGSVTSLMEEGMGPEEILERLLGDMDLQINDTMPARFFCDCSRERITRVLGAVSMKDLREMIADGEPIEVKCDFCGAAYRFGVDELKELLRARMQRVAERIIGGDGPETGNAPAAESAPAADRGSEDE
ncbi:MAG: Hsp33 family molecular chaperone HslO [Lachnospiraceae bacterium]|nr:Hsp33 family molecular chaperone HslO [Lachnospiraceae bacterium]